MWTFRIATPRARPRNRLVDALVRGLFRARTRIRPPGPRRPRDSRQLDLDQRVRETGEW